VLSAINEESSTLPALLTDYILNGKNDHQEPMVFLEHRVVLRATTTSSSNSNHGGADFSFFFL